MATELNCNETLQLLGIFVDNVKNIKEFYEKRKVKYRLPNFPEDISENIVKHLISRIENISCKRVKNISCKKVKKKGDLITDGTLKIEVKCFMSDGPSSFGPKECWHYIYFLDARDFLNGNYVLYKVSLSNCSKEFQNIPVNKKQTYGDQCKQKRRPHVAFRELRKTIEDHITVVFDGNLHDFFSVDDLESKLSNLGIQND